jgi:hypothetical protein
MVHPIIRPDATEAERLVSYFNEHLRSGEVELAEASRIAGRPIYAARELSPFDHASRVVAAQIRPTVGTKYIGQQLTRMQSAIRTDPELAIGTAKEPVEAVAKAVAQERDLSYSPAAELPQLVRLVARELRVTRQDVSDDQPGRRLSANCSATSPPFPIDSPP